MSGDAERLTENFALELFNWHLANNPKIHDLCLHAQEMVIALVATVNQSLTVDHVEQVLGMVGPVGYFFDFFSSNEPLGEPRREVKNVFARNRDGLVDGFAHNIRPLYLYQPEIEAEASTRAIKLCKDVLDFAQTKHLKDDAEKLLKLLGAE